MNKAKKKKVKKCRVCKKTFETLSQHGLCMVCGLRIMDDVVEQLRSKQGPYYNKWVFGLRRHIDRVIAEAEIKKRGE